MKIIKKNGETHLMQAIDEIRKKGSACLGIRIRLSQLTACKATPDVLDRMANLLRNHLPDDASDLYLLQQGDAILLLHHRNTAAITTIVRDICFMFAEDPLTQEPMGESGNRFCQLFKSGEDMIELHKLVIGLEAASHVVDDIAPLAPSGIDAIRFQQALYQRRMRSRIGILVVEDQPFNLQLVVQIIGRGFDIFTATDGATALKVYETQAPDVVFLDIDLPDIDGFQILKTVTEIDPAAFIVMLTASHKRQDVEYAMQNNAQGYIVKPFTKQKINQYVTLFKNRFPGRSKTGA